MTTRTRQVLINNCNSTIVPLSVDYSRYPLHCIPLSTDMLSDKVQQVPQAQVKSPAIQSTQNSINFLLPTKKP